MCITFAQAICILGQAIYSLHHPSYLAVVVPALHSLPLHYIGGIEETHRIGIGIGIGIGIEECPKVIMELCVLDHSKGKY